MLFCRRHIREGFLLAQPIRRDADRDLLFGVLALQNDFIDGDRLVAAFRVWSRSKDKALADVLIEQGALASEDRALLETLVSKHVQRHGDDPQKSLVALSTIGSVRQKLAKLADDEADDELKYSLAVAGSRPHEQDDPDATRMPAPAERVGASRFRIVRPHAKGGLGLVSVAIDDELDRMVALKEIQSHHADDQTSRARFVLEAEVTGKLEHPGIVPVYGLGHDSTGRPYYAMRFIQGDSLQEAVARFHQKEASPNLRSRQAVARFARAARPVHRRLQCGGLCAQPRGFASGLEAGERDARPVRRDLGGRLGIGENHGTRRRRRVGVDRTDQVDDFGVERPSTNSCRFGGRHAGVYESRASRRPARRPRPGDRRLQSWGHALSSACRPVLRSNAAIRKGRTFWPASSKGNFLDLAR